MQCNSRYAQTPFARYILSAVKSDIKLLKYYQYYYKEYPQKIILSIHAHPLKNLFDVFYKSDVV